MNMEVKNRAPERIKLETRIRTLDVLAVTDITPKMRRIRLAGPELAGFQSPGHADHIKVFLSSDGRPLGRPELRPEGIAFDDGVAKALHARLHPAQLRSGRPDPRSRFRPPRRWPSRELGRQAAPGQTLVIGGPRGSLIIPDAYDWYFLAGDETALPAIGRRLEELPSACPSSQ